MKRSTSQRSSVTPKSSRSKTRHQQQQQQPPTLSSPSLDKGEVMSGSFGGGGAWAGTSLGLEQAEEAERLQSVRSARQKRTKPQDWISMTFHQYRLMNVVGSGTFGDVSNECRQYICTAVGYLAPVSALLTATVVVFGGRLVQDARHTGLKLSTFDSASIKPCWR